MRTRRVRRVVAKLQDKGPADLLAGMAANRQALLAFIDTLADDDWPKTVSYTHLDVYKRQSVSDFVLGNGISKAPRGQINSRRKRLEICYIICRSDGDG